MSNAPTLTLEQLDRLCRDGEWQRSARPTAPSGFAALDASLPGGGWPMGTLCELLTATPGIGELSLMIPALARLAQAGRYIAWIAPPYLPYAPALVQRGLRLERVLIVRSQQVQEALWAAEQALRCPAFGAVLGWPADITDRNVRRLQLAAEAGRSLGILYRPADVALGHSPAALRLRLTPMPEGRGLTVEIRKCRGGRTGARLQLPLSSHDAALAVHPSAAAGA
jgi:hypothetical protein